MKKSRLFIILSFFIIPSLIAIFLLDIAGFFSYSDTSFILAIIMYCFFVFIQHSSSRGAFFLSLYFLVLMGLSLIVTGTGTVTERFGEWFFIFFVMGLAHYGIEVWNMRTL